MRLMSAEAPMMAMPCGWNRRVKLKESPPRTTGPKGNNKSPLRSSNFLRKTAMSGEGGGKNPAKQKGGSMVRFLCRLALVLVALAAPVHAAQAQSIAETLSRWGLLGTWALDCSKPASSSNGNLSYATRRAGQVSHERDFGDRQDV